jgi:hypothetical protein
MNISVPDRLKSRMDAVEEKVNWSALACRAFEAKLAEVATRKGAAKMSTQDAIDRLRASQAQEEDEGRAAGTAEGMAWAKARATAGQLRRLAEARDSVHDWYFEEGLQPGSACSAFYFIVNDTNPTDADWSEINEFWERAVGDDVEITDEYVQGFAEGACAVWDEVSEHL